MRKIALLLAGILTVATATPARAEIYTNSDFYSWRSRMKNMTDFQASKLCERLEGSRVHFESHVYSVRKNGVISADMDGRDLWSMPEIELILLDDDQTETVRDSQDIEYYGNILDCSFNSTTGMLKLHVANGRLVMHY